MTCNKRYQSRLGKKTSGKGMHKRNAENVGAVEPTLRTIVEAQERERQSIVEDIHDGPLQMLVGASYHMQDAMVMCGESGEEARGHLANASELLKQAVHELRDIMGSLWPAALYHFGLIGAIKSKVEELYEAGWQAELVADPVELPKDKEASLYRIISEALTNVEKHAGLCQVRVSLRTSGSSLYVEVRDWGRGFELDLVEQGRIQGLGLTGMRERAESLGGKFELESRPGEGTRVGLQIPL